MESPPSTNRLIVSGERLIESIASFSSSLNLKIYACSIYAFPYILGALRTFWGEIVWKAERRQAWWPGGRLEFKLTYEGRLYGSNSKGDTRAAHKHEIRRVFHPQLKRLWKLTPQLSEPFDFVPFPLIMASAPGPTVPYEVQLANRFSCGPFQLV